MGMRTLLVPVFALLSLSVGWAGDKTPIFPDGAKPGGNFSPAIEAGGFVFVSGQTGYKDGKLPEEFEAEVQQTLDNVAVVLKKAGLDFSDAVTVQVYLTDMELFQRMNAVYVKNFPEPRPARTTVGVAKLVSSARIEITVTAWKNPAAAKKAKK